MAARHPCRGGPRDSRAGRSWWRPWRADPRRSSSWWRPPGGCAGLPGRRVQDGGRHGGGDGGGQGGRRRRVRRQRLRPGRPDGRSGPAWPTTSPRSSPRRPSLGAALGAPSWDDDDYVAKVEAVLAAAARRGELHLRDPRRRGRAALQAAGSAVVPHRDDARGGGRRRCGRGRTHSACRARRPAPTGAAWPTTTVPTRTGPSGRSSPRSAGARSVPLVAAGGVGGPDDVADLLVRGRGPGPGRDGVPALPRERRAGRRTRTPSRAPPSGDRRHPCLQRAAGPGPGQRHGAGPPRRRRRPTPRSTTPPGRCGPRRPGPATSST